MCHGWQSMGFFTSQKKVWGKCVTLGKVQGFLWLFPFLKMNTVIIIFVEKANTII